MKTKLKRIISAASALAVSATMLGGLTVTAGAAAGDKTSVYSGTPSWTALGGSAATVTNYYGLDTSTSADAAAHLQNSGGGSRRAYNYFTDTTPTDTQNVEVEFYLNISGSNTDTSHFYLMSDKYTTNADPSGGYILDIEYTSYLDAITINGTAVTNITTSTAAAYQPTTETKYAATGLLKYDVVLDFDSKQADVTVYGSTTKTYTVDFADTSVTGVKGFYSVLGRYLSGCAIYDVNVSTVEKASDEDNVESIASVEISGPDTMTFGADADTAADNNFSVVITGEAGTTITEANLDSRVTDFNVEWDIDGFKTENDTGDQYCDSYGAFTVNNSESVATSFALRKVPMNFFGKMTATVTYNGSTYTASKYVTALGNTTKATNVVLPEGGYPSDFNDYPDSLVDYTAVISGDNKSGSDIITGNFFIAGSDPGREAKLTSDTTGKYFRITKTATSKSDMFAHQLSVSSGQVIYKQKLRFNSANGCVTFTTGFPIWSSSSGYSEVANLTFTGSSITLDGTALASGDAAASFQTGVWYDVVISIDTTTGKAWAKVFDTSGSLVGEASNVALTTNNIPTYYALGIANSSTGTIDFGGYSIYYPAADTSTYKLSASQDTLSIPNGDTADLTASLQTADGYELTGEATWSVLEEDMQEGVIITPDEDDSHKATVTLSETAEAGTATVQVNIGGYTKTVALNITSSAESVKFTKSSASVSIPLDDTATVTEYAAAVVDGSGTALDRAVTLAVYDKNNAAEYMLPTGISFDAATGILTVEKTASPCTFTIRATGTNTDGESISKAVKVTVHGLSFDFGTSADDAVAEGYTAVAADTSYTAARGYGIASGSPVAAGTASASDAAADYLEGSFTFNANVTQGKIYTVEITYSGTLTTAYVNSDLAGYTLGTQDSLAAATYTVPVPGDVLDLTVTDGSIAAVTITKQADRTARVKPVVHDIGDSTAANNGSWAYYISHNTSEFPTLTAVCDFHSDGSGGTNLATYYTQGKLAAVLRDIYPGDVLMLGNMGTNGMGSYFETDVNYYLDAAEAMGAKIILNTYTPHGAVSTYASGYNSSTNTFDSYRKDSYDVIIRQVAEERAASDPNYLGLVEIGKNADAIFNAYVADYAANDYKSADAAAQAIIACFPDHNHYNNNTLACKLMLNGYGGVKGIIAQLAEWNITSENIGAATSGDAKSTGFKFTIKNGLLYSGSSFGTYKGTVTSNGTTKSFESASTAVTLQSGAECIIAMFVEGLADDSAAATLEVE